MSTISRPVVSPDHPDRHAHCQESLREVFQSVVDRAMAAGWGEPEVASAIVELAENHLLTTASGTEIRVIDIIRRIT